MANQNLIENPVVSVALPVPLYRIFEYQLPDHLPAQQVLPGVRVNVPFGSRQLVGIVTELGKQATIKRAKLKPISRILDESPVWSETDLAWLMWMSHYYHHPLGEVFSAALPAALREGKAMQHDPIMGIRFSTLGAEVSAEQLKRAPKQQALWQWLLSQTLPVPMSSLSEHSSAVKALLEKGYLEQCVIERGSLTPSSRACLTTNTAQQAAIDDVCQHLQQFRVALLHGVTGSGKTEVYMQIIQQVLSLGRQVLVLLPEITLTPQLEQRFRQRFHAAIVTSHSKLTDTQRLNAWLTMRDGSASILLGTRSALFTPMANPGLVILDEEHDSSFKQQEGFRFSARDGAISRAKMLDIPVLLGSATPSLESLFNAQQQRYQLLELPERAGNAQAPDIQIMDIRNRNLQAGLSDALLQIMRDTLQQGQQVLLFLNRRGFAPVQMCHHCGWVSRCPHCDANMVIHAQDARLRCHHCNHDQARPQTCPSCQANELFALGTGTERIEHTLNELFPEQHIVRLDRDTTQRKGSLQNYLQQINSGHANIILGTQMLAKGHHFPNVTLVAILDIDSGLFGIDYRASERLAQMIMQVAGRAGRAETPGRVILQTRQPQHPLLSVLLRDGYPAFCENLLQERQQAALPPFSHQALMRVNANSAIQAQQFLQQAMELLQTCNQGHVQVLGPVPAPMTRRASQFRFQLLLQSPQRKALHYVLDQWLPQISELKTGSQLKWNLDVDPFDLY